MADGLGLPVNIRLETREALIGPEPPSPGIELAAALGMLLGHPILPCSLTLPLNGRQPFLQEGMGRRTRLDAITQLAPEHTGFKTVGMAVRGQHTQPLGSGFPKTQRVEGSIGADRLLTDLRAGQLVGTGAGDPPTSRIAPPGKTENLQEAIFDPGAPVRP